MTDSSKTRPSDATRAEEERDAQVRAGTDGSDTSAPVPDEDASVDPEVAESYEEMIARGAAQKGEGRLP